MPRGTMSGYDQQGQQRCVCCRDMTRDKKAEVGLLSSPRASFIFQPPDREPTGEEIMTSVKPTLLRVFSTAAASGWVAPAGTDRISCCCYQLLD